MTPDEPTSSIGPVLRPATVEDHDALVELWNDTGISIPEGDSRRELAAKLERDPQLFVVLEGGDRLIGSAMGSFDGRRGWIGRLCVRDGRRRHGHATALIAAVEHELRLLGCVKVNLLVEPHDETAVEFYGRRGFVCDDLVFMEKWLHEP